MTDNTRHPLLVIGSILVLAIAWLVVVVYWIISPFIPVRLSEAQKNALWEAFYG